MSHDRITDHTGALAGVDRLHLVTLVMRVACAEQVSAFVDLAAAWKEASQ